VDEEYLYLQAESPGLSTFAIAGEIQIENPSGITTTTLEDEDNSGLWIVSIMIFSLTLMTFAVQYLFKKDVQATKSIHFWITIQKDKGYTENKILSLMLKNGWDEHLARQSIHLNYKLHNYIEYLLHKGYTHYKIKRHLKKHGWDVPIIDVVLKSGQGS